VTPISPKRRIAQFGKGESRSGEGILPEAMEGGGHEAREAARARCRFAPRASFGRWRAREILGTPKKAASF
jgi:hypothetical protein